MKRILILPVLLLAACAPRTVAQPAAHVYRAGGSAVIAAIRAACPAIPSEPFYDNYRLAAAQGNDQICFAGPSLAFGSVEQSAIATMTFTVNPSGDLTSVTVVTANGASQTSVNAVFARLDQALPRLGR